MRAARSSAVALSSATLPMQRDYREDNTKGAARAPFSSREARLAMVLVVIGAGFVASVAANRRPTQRAERAAARHRRAERAACRRAADRADGLTATHAGARRQTDHTGHRTKSNQGLHHMHLLVKRWSMPAAQVQPRSRKITNRTGIGTPR